ncbi:glycosyltransferase [Xanthobacter autotrophicus]|uniref:glycosyltransferase n=1 Tax=Xanthobacter autotrophicus TaxID=280 RepID=UPI0037286217
MTVKVLYVASGHPSKPRAGMDVVVREHIAELARDPRLEVEGVSVALVDKAGVDDCPPWHGVRVIPSDLSTAEPGRLKSLKLRHLRSGRLMDGFGFASEQAKAELAALLAKDHDVIVVDHIHGFINLPILKLITSGRKIVFISHDHAPKAVFDRRMVKTSPLSQVFIAAETAYCTLVEAALTRRATRTVFISSHDRDKYGWLLGKSGVALCPILVGEGGAPAEPRADLANRVVFIGSAAFFPNRAAIDWIVNVLALKLETIAPELKISLVGSNVAKVFPSHGPNVEMCGFVPDAELKVLLASCLCLLSPVVHGSGLKIKLLEAFSAAAPVVATAESLRGFDFMGIAPQVELDRPEAVARTLAELYRDGDRRATLRRDLARTWGDFVERRTGALADLVVEAVG